VKSWKKTAILGIALLAFGAARLPFETGLRSELRAAGLAPAPMEIGTRDKIGQTSSAVALGGLRTLVATFLNLRAFTFFTEQRWDDVADTFDTIVDLAPRTRYYWETGSWHMAYNAASYYLNLENSEMPSLRRREAWRASIVRGRAFLERGIRNNPNDWNLLANLGFLLSDSNKFPAFRDSAATFSAAADAYGKAADTGNALGYVRRAQFYSLARVPGREKEALALGRSLHAERINHTPTLLILLFVLEAHENPQMDTLQRALELFGTPEKAYEALTGHWQRTRERFPVHGVAASLESLEKSLAVPADKSIFKQEIPGAGSVDDWFEK
jgi:tetratricopeptide (TPR) repeat protein